MDVRIISNCDNSACRALYGELVLQSTDDVNKMGPFIGKKYYIFNIGLNERYEILPSMVKYDFIKVIDCDYESKNLYFISCKEIRHKAKINVMLIRYSIVSGNSQIIYSFEDDKSILYNEKHMKIFVLDESHIIIQNEYLKEDEYGNNLGFLDIEMHVIDVSSGKAKQIYDKVITDSGIDTIIPLKGNLCIMKTGYSLIVDNRFDLIKEADRPVERLAIININQFISDLLLNKTTIYTEPIEKFEKDVTYPYMKKMGDYLVYSKVNMVSHVETVVYYNINDKSLKTYTNKEVYRSIDLLNPCIINDVAYFIRHKNDTYYFNDGEGVVKYELSGCKLKQIINNLVITEKLVPKKLFNKAHLCVEIYNNLASEPIIREKGAYIDAVATDKQNLFIFTKNGIRE